MQHKKPTWIASLIAVLALGAGAAAAPDEGLFNTEIYESPWAGEPAGKGTFSVVHEGEGAPPKEGYFLQHAPGEKAEYHLFVPDGLAAGRRYPLLIVYHGGKDGASGKGMCRSFASISTANHPVIVLAPNMYTMDAFNELVAEARLPIDRNRVVVYGHSSGGMGVRSAMVEYARTQGAFVPAALICSSTTATAGRTDYPPCPYYVMAGEKETPAYVQNQILKDRRRTCRIHALVMQQVFADVRYIEVQGSGHAGGTPVHRAVIQHALAVSERAPVEFTTRPVPPEWQPFSEAARAGEWERVRREMARLDEAAGGEPDAAYGRLRGDVLGALERWFAAQTRTIAGLRPDSDYVERDRAFARYDRCRALAEAFAETKTGPALARSLESLAGAKHWQAELAAREAYRKIVSERPSAEMKAALQALRKSAPDTEYGRNRTREKLLALEEVQARAEPEEPPDGPPIRNPYFEHVKWRVWRDDATPIENVQTLIQQGKERRMTTITLAPAPVAKRIYPDGPLREGRPIRWKTLATPSKRFAGVWDDVYASWSGLHGYVRPSWQATDGSAVDLRPKGLDHFMHFVEMRKTNDLLRCGINFVHQSTTGMSHTITNGYDVRMTTTYERIYFADCLVTAPAHASYTEDRADRTKDLVLALVPTLFNSVGSSNSETMAITKLMIAGGYLPPESKRTLKRNGLYPSALLYLWKAALPFDVPFDHELRHRVAYRSLGNEEQFKGRYGHAGFERGNLSLEYHRYDEIAHMRNMIRLAESMTVLPPEAILDDVQVEGGKTVYALEKTALILQEPGVDVTVRVSAAKSYDLADRPLVMRCKLLYGNHATSCVPGGQPDTFVIRVPNDDTLPEGRTAIALIANNGVHDGNPAVVNIYRKRGELPPPGAGPGGYRYDSPYANRRPVLLGLQDLVVRPGRTIKLVLDAVDPEGFPVRFFKRAGEPGELDGNVYTLRVPRGKAGEDLATTFIASDATAGNSYAAKRVTFSVAPRVHAHIEADRWVGPAPLKVAFSSKGSLPSRGKVERGWEFYTPVPKRKPAAFKQLAHDAAITHTFEKPGLYEVELTVKSGEETDRETVQVWVTDKPPPAAAPGVAIEGNEVRIEDGDDTPCAFDHTDFGTVRVGKRLRRRFTVFNRGGEEIRCPGRAVTVTGPGAKAFRVAHQPAKRISARGSTTFEVEFRPKEAGPAGAEVAVHAGDRTLRFAVAGTGAEK